MIEVHPDGGAQGRKEDVGDIGMAVFRERSSGFDEQLSQRREQSDAQARDDLPRHVAGTCVHDAGGEPCDDGAQDDVYGSVVRVRHVVVEGDERADFEMEVGRTEVERVEKGVQDQQGVVTEPGQTWKRRPRPQLHQFSPRPRAQSGFMDCVNERRGRQALDMGYILTSCKTKVACDAVACGIVYVYVR